MSDDVFEGRIPHPDMPELGRAIYLDPDAPSGSPANYEELRGCPSVEGWTKFKEKLEATGIRLEDVLKESSND